MEIDASKLSAPDMYRLLTGIVVPRPIAWVTSMSSNGIVNAAPFSAFTWVSTDPAILGFSIGLRQGMPKDTARNVASSKNYVVNIADADDTSEHDRRDASNFRCADSHGMQAPQHP
jgi:flavin reductase (DIM6/NTAB) family NADH-FMN oxidoreductase RutF